MFEFSCFARSSAVLLPPYLPPLYPNPFIRPPRSRCYSIIISFSEREPLLYNHDGPDLISYYVLTYFHPQVALDLGLSYSKLKTLIREGWDSPSRMTSLLATVSTVVSCNSYRTFYPYRLH